MVLGFLLAGLWASAFTLVMSQSIESAHVLSEHGSGLHGSSRGDVLNELAFKPGLSTILQSEINQLRCSTYPDACMTRETDQIRATLSPHLVQASSMRVVSHLQKEGRWTRKSP